MTRDSIKIYDALKGDIIRLKYKPGTRFGEVEIARKYQVSRTPIRDVLKHLECDGLVEVHSQSGTFVSKVDEHWIENTAYIRSAVEVQILSEVMSRLSEEDFAHLRDILAGMKRLSEEQKGEEMRLAENYIELDDAFHAYLSVKAGRMDILKRLNQESSLYQRFRFLAFLRGNEEAELLYSIHERIVDVLESKDRTKLPKVVYDHNNSGLVALQKVKERHPEFFVYHP